MAVMIITSRLLCGVKVSDSFISIEPIETIHGRTRYRFYIDTPEFEFTGDDLLCRLWNPIESLLSFLGACGEAYAYKMRTGRESENYDLFPPHVAEWCYANSDELSMVQHELQQENGDE